MDNIFKSSVTEPFDPSTLKAEVRNATIGQLVEMLRNDLIDLYPDFQRHANLWGADKKSQLIESILLGLPLPSFYFYNDSKEKKWVVIDGLQRLCALKSFMVDGDLTLKGLEFLDEQKYCKPYSEFSYYDKLAISMHPVTLNVLSGSASAEARYIIFQRVNSKGTPLYPVEVRNALYQGPATNLITKMVSEPIFKQMISDKISILRMKDREYATRFLAFYLLDYRNYPEYRNLNHFLCMAMDVMNHNLNSNKELEIIEAFKTSMSICHTLLGDEAFRNPQYIGGRRSQVSIAIFEMLTVTISRLSKEKQHILTQKRSEFIEAYKEMFDDYLMQKFLSSGMSNTNAVRYRFEHIERVIYHML